MQADEAERRWRRALLAWYDRAARRLPWRTPPGAPRPDPYRGLALRGDAAADHRRGRRGATSPPSWRAGRRVADAGGGARGRGDGRLGGARLLRPRPQPARLRPGGGGASAAAASPTPRPGCAALPGDRPLHRRGDRGDRLRPAGRGGRRQRRAGDGAAPRGRGAAAGGQAAAARAGRRPDPGRAARRLRPGGDGPRRHRLHAAAPGLRPLPLGGGLRRPRARGSRRRCRGGRRSRRSRSARASPTWRCGTTARVLVETRPAARPPRRHAGAALQRLDRERRRPPGRPSPPTGATSGSRCATPSPISTCCCGSRPPGCRRLRRRRPAPSARRRGRPGAADPDAQGAPPRAAGAGAGPAFPRRLKALHERTAIKHFHKFIRSGLSYCAQGLR